MLRPKRGIKTYDVLLKVMNKYLDSKGYEVSTSPTGKEALALLNEERYDIVVCDIELPDMNGYELLRIIRKNYPKIGICLITAYTNMYNYRQAKRVGADSFLSKPFSLKDFTMAFEKTHWSALERLEEEEA